MPDGGGGTTAIRVELAWPDKKLNPNARPHYRVKHKANAAANDEAYWLTRAAMGVAFGPTTTKIAHDGKSDIILNQVAHPPDKRSRDRDNIDAALKGHRDGIAKALGVNDRFLRPTGIEWGEVVPGGRVVITIDGVERERCTHHRITQRCFVCSPVEPT